jgi:adenylate cyclase
MADEGFKRKLTAVLSADAVEYSRLMAEDEAATVKTIASYREIMSSLIKQHRGRVVDSPGDNVLAEFSSVVDAVQCAVAVQNEFQARNAELGKNRQMQFRIGINLGDVIDEDDRTLRPDWNHWLIRGGYAFQRLLLIKSRPNCR